MPSRAAFGIKTLREAVRRRVEETSIRAVAEEIGMSPSGLHVLLNGSAPQPATREKLVSWYAEQRRVRPSGDAVSKADVDAALCLLVQYVRQDTRTEAQVKRIHEIVRRLESECAPENK